MLLQVVAAQPEIMIKDLITWAIILIGLGTTWGVYSQKTKQIETTLKEKEDKFNAFEVKIKNNDDSQQKTALVINSIQNELRYLQLTQSNTTTELKEGIAQLSRRLEGSIEKMSKELTTHQKEVQGKFDKIIEEIHNLKN